MRASVWGVRGWVTEDGQTLVEDSVKGEAGDKIIPAENSAGGANKGDGWVGKGERKR